MNSSAEINSTVHKDEVAGRVREYIAQLAANAEAGNINSFAIVYFDKSDHTNVEIVGMEKRDLAAAALYLQNAFAEIIRRE